MPKEHSFGSIDVFVKGVTHFSNHCLALSVSDSVNALCQLSAKLTNQTKIKKVCTRFVKVDTSICQSCYTYVFLYKPNQTNVSPTFWTLLKFLPILLNRIIEDTDLALCLVWTFCPVWQFPTASKNFLLQIFARLCDYETEDWTEIDNIVKALNLGWLGRMGCLRVSFV